MQNLAMQDITTLFVFLDDCIEKRTSVGRPSVLTDSEMLTILIWCSHFLRMKNIKNIHQFIEKYRRGDFPKIPDYSNFVKHGQRMIPVMTKILEESFDTEAELRFADSTMIPVCRLIRADSHKVARGLADFGKNWQGWHFGFKLHGSVNLRGEFCGIHFTPASFHDAQSLPFLVRGKAKIVVGDGTYNARVMRGKLWKAKGVFVLAPPHPKQTTKIMTMWQKRLLEARPRIESVWDILKEHYHLVTSFPRSVLGYLFHYLRILLSYQLAKAIN